MVAATLLLAVITLRMSAKRTFQWRSIRSGSLNCCAVILRKRASISSSTNGTRRCKKCPACEDLRQGMNDSQFAIGSIARKDILARLYAGGRRFFR